MYLLKVAAVESIVIRCQTGWHLYVNNDNTYQNIKYLYSVFVCWNKDHSIIHLYCLPFVKLSTMYTL